MDHTPMPVRYLSLEWIEALGRCVAESTELAEITRDRELGFTQVISDGPEGTVVYHLQVASGRTNFGAGPADPEHVRFEESWDTAVAVATGELPAQEAFLNGRIRLIGDPERVLDAHPVFRELDAVFRSVHERTEYR